MRKTTGYILVVMILIISLQLSPAQDYPSLTPFVNDFGKYLTSDQISSLNARCQKIEQNTTYEIAIVTVTTTNGDDRLIYANELGERNGVGKKATDNGLVILWTQENEKGLAIAVGRGAESLFNDAKVARIARDARSLFDDGKYYEGFNKILDDLESELKFAEPLTNVPVDVDFMDIVIIVIVIFLVIFVIAQLFKNNDNDFVKGALVGSIVSNVLRGGRSGGGGSFSGGGFSGGSFGGGGGHG